MKRERMLQVAVGLLGLVYVAMIYPLYTDLAHSKWLLEMKTNASRCFLVGLSRSAPFFCWLLKSHPPTAP